MRTYWPLIACLAACGFEPGSLPADAGAGGTGDAIDARVIDADPTIDAFEDTDVDMDGRLASVDNCPTIANANQRNHDGDVRGDACDLCPHISTTLDPDTDGDMIGDVCDPRPNADDTLVVFDGFYDDSLWSSWAGSGNWAVDTTTGMLEQTNENTELAYTYLPMTIARHSITAGIKIDTVGTPVNQTNPAVYVAGGSVSDTQSYYCGVLGYSSPAMMNYIHWQEQGNNEVEDFSLSGWTGTFASGSRLELTSAILGADHRCTASQGTLMPVVANQPHGPTSGAVLLVTTRMAASYDYVFIVSVGSP